MGDFLPNSFLLKISVLIFPICINGQVIEVIVEKRRLKTSTSDPNLIADVLIVLSVYIRVLVVFCVSNENTTHN